MYGNASNSFEQNNQFSGGNQLPRGFTPTPPNSQPGSQPPLFGQFSNAGLNNEVIGIGVKTGQQFVAGRVQQYLPLISELWESLRFYFSVNNQYVTSKLKIILFPFQRRSWVRCPMDTPTPSLSPPSQDVNCPDLYIPFMSFITFVLMTGFFKGTNNDSFTPEDLVSVSSTCLVTMIIEILLIKAGFQFLGLVASCLSTLDLISILGYKFVLLCVAMAAALLLGSAGFIVLLLYIVPSYAYFLIKTLSAMISPDSLSLPEYRSTAIIIASGIECLMLVWLSIQ